MSDEDVMARNTYLANLARTFVKQVDAPTLHRILTQLADQLDASTIALSLRNPASVGLTPVCLTCMTKMTAGQWTCPSCGKCVHETPNKPTPPQGRIGP